MQPTLLRRLSTLNVTALVVSNMVGTGIFTTTGFLAGDLGSPTLVLLIWVAGAICALFGALCYAELGLNFPASGGEYLYLKQAYGPTWGFLTGWVSFFAGFSAPVAAAALAFADYTGYFFPAFQQKNAGILLGSGDWSFRLGGAQLLASGLIGVFTILNCFGVERIARVQNVLTAVKVLILVLFLVMGFLAGQGSWSHLGQSAVRSSSTPIAAQFAVSLFWIYVSYSGWNAAIYVAEEIKNPQRTLPIALACGTVFVAVLYLALNTIFLYAAPLEEMKGKIAVGAFAASKLFGPQIAGVFSAFMALSLLATVNAMAFAGPRVYYAMARDRMFFSIAARVHPRWRTPVAAILAQGVCSMLMTLTPFPQLIVYIGFTLNFFAVMAVASLFYFRKQEGWQRLRPVSVLYPLIPAVFLLAGLWMTWEGIRQKPVISLATVVTLILGAASYQFWRRKESQRVPVRST